MKFLELEKGKIYATSIEGEKIFCRITESGRLWKTRSSHDISADIAQELVELWDIKYNDLSCLDFKELSIKIDWSKVPTGTRVKVKDKGMQKYINRYFVEYDTGLIYPFKISILKEDDDYAGIKVTDYTSCYKFCELAEGETIPNYCYNYVLD